MKGNGGWCSIQRLASAARGVIRMFMQVSSFQFRFRGKKKWQVKKQSSIL